MTCNLYIVHLWFETSLIDNCKYAMLRICSQVTYRIHNNYLATFGHYAGGISRIGSKLSFSPKRKTLFVGLNGVYEDMASGGPGLCKVRCEVRNKPASSTPFPMWIIMAAYGNEPFLFFYMLFLPYIHSHITLMYQTITALHIFWWREPLNKSLSNVSELFCANEYSKLLFLLVMSTLIIWLQLIPFWNKKLF